jgi:hypothetical protein
VSTGAGETSARTNGFTRIKATIAISSMAIVTLKTNAFNSKATMPKNMKMLPFPPLLIGNH